MDKELHNEKHILICRRLSKATVPYKINTADYRFLTATSVAKGKLLSKPPDGIEFKKGSFACYVPTGV